MNRNARILFASLIAAIVVAGLAAIYILWEHGPDEQEETLAGMEKFTASADEALAPEIKFEDGERHKRTLADFRGGVVVVNFWATWCTPCVRELPSLDRLQGRLKDKGVTIIALSLDRGGVDAVKRFYDENGIRNLGVYVDTTMGTQQAFDIPGLPTTVLIDAKGRDRGRLIGPADWGGEDAAELILSASK
ncbi:MAG: redoxin domain-containing protein [Alphaproteobacteria bacterium]|nr:redoxin domain-containing protein [Alphaproteobacteria bacterium]